jgi:Rho GDP-dissociation inhibitor
MNRWKASLGLNPGNPIGKPGDPNCVIKSLALVSPGRENVVIDLSNPASLSTLKDHPFKIKEGAKFHIRAVFQVNNDVLSGLKYVQVVKRKGIRVSKDQEMLGSYAPSTSDKPTYEKDCEYRTIFFNQPALTNCFDLVAEEEAPSGMIARGHYNAVSCFVDDDDHTHLQFEWSFDIAKDW